MFFFFEQNLLAELNRLNEELAQIREKSLQQFVESLELDDIGISKRMNSNSFRKPSKVTLGDGPSTFSSYRYMSNVYFF